MLQLALLSWTTIETSFTSEIRFYNHIQVPNRQIVIIKVRGPKCYRLPTSFYSNKCPKNIFKANFLGATNFTNLRQKMLIIWTPFKNILNINIYVYNNHPFRLAKYVVRSVWPQPWPQQPTYGSFIVCCHH